MHPITTSQMTRQGNPHLGSTGREIRVLYNFFLECYSVSGTRSWGGGPGPGRWDVCARAYMQGASLLAMPECSAVPREGSQKREVTWSDFYPGCGICLSVQRREGLEASRKELTQHRIITCECPAKVRGCLLAGEARWAHIDSEEGKEGRGRKGVCSRLQAWLLKEAEAQSHANQSAGSPG